MQKNAPYLVSLDIGSSKVCVLIAETREDRLDIAGKGTALHKGARKGVIIDVPSTVEAIKRATEEAEIMAGVQVERAVVGIAVPDMKCFNTRQAVAVAAKNREITQEDIARALDAARSERLSPETEILHVLQRQFIVDGQDGVQDPLGMVGSRLEADVHVVTVPSAAKQNLVNCVNRAGIEVVDLIFEPLAASASVLTPDEKEHGVVLADVGAGTTEIAVWVNGAVTMSTVVKMGGEYFTNDLAVLLKTPVTEAERIKKKYGAALQTLVGEDEVVDVALTGGRGIRPVPKRDIAKYLGARADELLEEFLWRTVMQAVKTDEIRSGLVLTGGGADLDGLSELAEQKLGIQVRRGRPHGFGGLTDVISGPEWACAAGLLLDSRGSQGPARGRAGSGSDFLSRLKNKMKALFPTVSGM
ncbi:MAG: cell division protein FtsA [Acidobacteria bacterium]|nr:cell division protein FtsA [Acidobacteriota bacterium]MCG3194463.1 Cell division protein FtsA [Thermoanaerobaculia bacterium]MCK6684565.1 cell division protein FtsA [Thermoanaerobaculia bacterium]